MFVNVGLAATFGGLLGLPARSGQTGALPLWSGFIIVAGAALGAFLVTNPLSVVQGSRKSLRGLLKPNPYNEKAYSELLKVLYDVFQMARKDGLAGLEVHIEQPDKSDIFTKYPFFNSGSPRALPFVCETFKVLLTSTVDDHHLAEILDLDLRRQAEEARAVPAAIVKLGEALRVFAIVAALLVLVVMIGSIGSSSAGIGTRIAAALGGTILGVALSYATINPFATALEARLRSEHDYMRCIRTALLAFARGDSPMTCVEFARRDIEPVERPTFDELKALTRQAA